MALLPSRRHAVGALRCWRFLLLRESQAAQRYMRLALCLEPAQASVAFGSRSASCKARSSSGEALKLTLSRGRIRSGSGRGNNGDGIHRCSQRRDGEGSATERPCPGAAHSAHPSRNPWRYHYVARDESAGRSDDFPVNLGAGKVTKKSTSFIMVVISELCEEPL